MLIGNPGENYTGKETAAHAETAIRQKVHIAQNQHDHYKYPQRPQSVFGISASQSLVCELKRVPIDHPSHLELEYYAHIDGIKCRFYLFNAWSASNKSHDDTTNHV